VYGHEPAASQFRLRLEAAARGDLRLITSRITLGEITYNILRKERLGEIPHRNYRFADLPWQILSVDDSLVDQAAQIKALYPISFADCFVAALARRYNAPVIPGDPDFQKLNAAGVVGLEWIGR
jgi:ribonuclease VapC